MGLILKLHWCKSNTFFLPSRCSIKYLKEFFKCCSHFRTQEDVESLSGVVFPRALQPFVALTHFTLVFCFSFLASPLGFIRFVCVFMASTHICASGTWPCSFQGFHCCPNGEVGGKGISCMISHIKRMHLPMDERRDVLRKATSLEHRWSCQYICGDCLNLHAISRS